MSTSASPLGRVVATPRAPVEIDRMRQQAWRDGGLVCLRLDEIPDPKVREAVASLATRKFGKRYGGAGS